MIYTVLLSGLEKETDLWSENLAPTLEKQLSSQNPQCSDVNRYFVFMTIVEGSAARVWDIDNYYKPIIDSVRKGQLWADDSQIDGMHVVRLRSRTAARTHVSISIHEAAVQACSVGE